MSVTFWTPASPDCSSDCEGYDKGENCPPCAERSYSVNLSNQNAADVLGWLGFPVGEDLCGRLPTSELAARCQRRLWAEERNQDPAREIVVERRAGSATVIHGGREAGYLRRRAGDLLRLATRAKEIGAEEIFYG